MHKNWMIHGKPIAALLLCLAMILSFAGCANPDTRETTAATEEQYIVPATEAATEPATQAPTEPAADLVTDAYTDALDDGWQLCCYHIPQVNLNGKADALNAKIYDQMYSELQEYVYQSMKDYGYPDVSYMLYIWGQKDDLLSIVVQVNSSMVAWVDYYVFTISLETGEEVTADVLCAAYGLTEAGFQDLAKTTLQTYWDGRKETLIQNLGENYYQSLVDRTLEQENVASSIPYINADGELCMVANIYSPAGADSYLHLLNTASGAEEPRIECAETHVIEATEAAETEPAQTLETVSVTEEDILGEWVIDTEYTAAYSNVSMWDIYGSSFSGGENKMTFGADGAYQYYVGWCYGNGTFQIENGEIIAQLTDGDPIQGTLKLMVMKDGVLRIALDQYEDGTLVFWTKA